MKFTCPIKAKKKSNIAKGVVSTSSAVVPAMASSLAKGDLQSLVQQAFGLSTSTVGSACVFAPGISWYIDSGASNHMSFNDQFFSSSVPIIHSPITTANGSSLSIKTIGTIHYDKNFLV